MTRLVNHVRKTPYKVEKDGVSMWICGCGLTTNEPFCNGAHKKIQEEPNGTFFYDLDMNRIEFTGSETVDERYQ